MKNYFYTFLKRFHNDETGANALETVILIAIAATVVAVFIMWGDDIVDWGKGLLDEVISGEGITGGGE
ncbi:MAG: hypothetical protein LBE12_13650 [Planctomycetaceae bacterium]|nr:hypothetical protein [Planctomycetaceae bacterium]